VKTPYGVVAVFATVVENKSQNMKSPPVLGAVANDAHWLSAKQMAAQSPVSEEKLWVDPPFWAPPVSVPQLLPAGGEGLGVAVAVQTEVGVVLVEVVVVVVVVVVVTVAGSWQYLS
jgi:hypothetical protein